MKRAGFRLRWDRVGPLALAGCAAYLLYRDLSVPGPWARYVSVVAAEDNAPQLLIEMSFPMIFVLSLPFVAWLWRRRADLLAECSPRLLSLNCLALSMALLYWFDAFQDRELKLEPKAAAQFLMDTDINGGDDVRVAKRRGELPTDAVVVFENNASAIGIRGEKHLARARKYYAAQGIPFDDKNGFDLRKAFHAIPSWPRRHEDTTPAGARLGSRLLAKQVMNDAEFYWGSGLPLVAIDRLLDGVAALPDDPFLAVRLAWMLAVTEQFEEAKRWLGMVEKMRMPGYLEQPLQEARLALREAPQAASSARPGEKE